MRVKSKPKTPEQVEEKDVYFEVRGFDTNGGLPSNLKRGLEARHLTMISIGGTIGTGLFLASGGAISSGGPGGALVAYMIVGFMIYFMMASLGEMATYLPISGSFNTYAKRYVDPALGFALGWNYWYSWSVTVAVEITAGSIVIQYWISSVPTWLWSILLLLIMVSFNFFSVRGYGEAEYWFSMTKIVTVIIFIVIAFLLDLGVIGDPPERIGGSIYNRETFHHGFIGLFSVFLSAGFSFQGTELVGIAAGESSNPRKHVPKAIRQVFWRILLFYVLAIFAIGLLIPYDDPNLLNNSANAAMSPFTLVFQKTGLKAAPHLMNAVIMITVLSAGNSGLYASSRVLYNLALEGFAPRVFTNTSNNGVPIPALLATASVGCLAFLMSLFGDGRVYTWLLNLSGVSGFITWAGISFTHWRFRRAYVAQGRPMSELHYRASCYPFGPIFALVLIIIVIAGQGYTSAYVHGHFDIQLSAIIAAYIGAPAFLILYLSFKFFKKTKIVPLLECDFDTDRRVYDPEIDAAFDRSDEKKVSGNLIWRGVKSVLY
ncbi:hypothetical protein G9A89_008242 [Geosiphon pyriformis]|nr:hypothetical protein G9A89_008242 [Geosiphon pyriformis]